MGTSIIRLSEKPKNINYSLKTITDSHRRHKSDTLSSNYKISAIQFLCSYTNITESRSQKTSITDKQHQLTSTANILKIQLNNRQSKENFSYASNSTSNKKNTKTQLSKGKIWGKQ